MAFREWLRRQPLKARAGVTALIGFVAFVVWDGVVSHDLSEGIANGVGLALGLLFVVYAMDRMSTDYATRHLDLEKDEHEDD